MSINIYEFFDLTMETFSDYVSKYHFELNNFLNEFEDNTEGLFIDYQKGYLKKMTQAIIESMNEIDPNDPDSEFVFNHLQKKLSTNRRILEFLDNRLNTPNEVLVPGQKNNTPNNYFHEYLNDVNNGLVTKLDMINYLKSYNSIEEFEAITKGIERYYAHNIINNLFLNEENFNSFKELVLSKIEELKYSKITSNKTSKKHYTENLWFEVGLLLAEGKIQEFRKDNPKISFKNIAIHFGNKSYESYIKATLQEYIKNNRDKNIYLNIEKMENIIRHCEENKIEICDFFMQKYNEKARQLK